VEFLPGGRKIVASPDENILGAALAAGIALPYSCRAGRCATCKAKLLAGAIEYPEGRLPPGIVASEAAKGEVLLCQARARSDLRIQARTAGGSLERPLVAVLVGGATALPTGGFRVTLRIVGEAPLTVRLGQFVDAETADGRRERVPVVAITAGALDVEMLELAPGDVVKASGPFDTPR
jgi:CDP-4-dehydro-6-deoxyglucose reductase